MMHKTYLKSCLRPPNATPKHCHLWIGLTGTMSEFKAKVCSPEFIHRDRKFQQLRPPGTVVVIQYKGVVFAGWWLPWAKGDKILIKKMKRGKAIEWKGMSGLLDKMTKRGSMKITNSHWLFLCIRRSKTSTVCVYEHFRPAALKVACHILSPMPLSITGANPWRSKIWEQNLFTWKGAPSAPTSKIKVISSDFPFPPCTFHSLGVSFGIGWDVAEKIEMQTAYPKIKINEKQRPHLFPCLYPHLLDPPQKWCPFLQRQLLLDQKPCFLSNEACIS